MQFKVTKLFKGNRETHCGQCKTREEAQAFVEQKLAEDKALTIKAIYRIYEWDDMLEEFDPSKAESAPKEENSSQGKGSGATFSPTPFSSTPRPAGMPQNWVKDEDKKK